MKFFLLSLITAFSVGSYAKDAHKAHVHGISTLDISIEKNKIEAEVEIPGIDLVGFEGEAKTKEHKDNLKKVTDLLTKDYNLFLMSEEAGCKVTKRDLNTDHKKGHSDYEYKIEYECSDISKVTELDVNLFRDIETMKKITVQLVTETDQKSFKLSPTASKINVK